MQSGTKKSLLKFVNKIVINIQRRLKLSTLTILNQ